MSIKGLCYALSCGAASFGRIWARVIFNLTSRPTRSEVGRPSIFWILMVGTVVGAIFIGGVTWGLFLANKNSKDPWPLNTWPLNTKAFKFETIETALNTLEIVKFPIGSFRGGGGAIAVVDKHILFVTPRGKLGFLRQGSGGVDYEIRYIDAAVPMKYAELSKSALAKDEQFRIDWFRTFDMLPLRRADGSYGLYISHHRYAEKCIEFVVSRVTIEASQNEFIVDGSSWEDIFVAEPCIEMKERGDIFDGGRAGGRLARTSRNTLMVTVGDHQFDGVYSRNSAPMDPQTHLGKAVEINLDTKNATIFSSGLRNPQGLTISSEGLIWETEHGPIGGDELNVLQLGRNYGWPEVTYGVNYGGQAWPLNQVQGRHDKYTKPAYAFVPSIGISSLIETNSDEFPRWKGDLLVTSLKNQAIWRLRRDADRIIYSERIQIGQRLRDIQELPNGQLIVLTDAGNLAIIRRKPVLKGQPARHDLTITVDGYGAFPKVFADEPLLFKPKDRWDSGGETFKAHCAGCHAVSDETIVGPPLADVVGREIGSIQGYPYSDELAGAGGIWTEQRLVEFLSNPQENFKETSMPRIILMAHEYNEIVKYLNETD